jgi:multiple sugar transport system ATP-binding protein
VVARTLDFELDLTTAARHHAFSAYANREMVLGMRPEDVRLATDEMPVTVTAILEVVEQLGSSTILYLNTGHQRLTLEASGSLQVQVGEQVPLYLPPAYVYLFDEETEGSILSPGLLATDTIQTVDG